VVERDHAPELSPLHLSAPVPRELVEEANEMSDGYGARAHRLTHDVMGNADHADIVQCPVGGEDDRD
jgi:hypothetical protein